MTHDPQRTALIAVDVQRDFLPGGALAVPDGDAVIAPLLRIAAVVDVVIATRDWHPLQHMSFTVRGGHWPEHCVQNTPGAEVTSQIASSADVIISKGDDPAVDAYSGFDGTGLAELLRERGVSRVIIGGLATDYCVRATALDAVAAGFETVVAADAVRAVNIHLGDEDAALEDLLAAGVRLWTSKQIVETGFGTARNHQEIIP